MISKVLFSSDSNEWETPYNIFNLLNNKYKFDCDVCATNENKKCEKFFSYKDNGLISEWNGNIWCNPPYDDIISWVRKASTYRKGIVCVLVPVRTDTKWFTQYGRQASTIYLIEGRLKFNDTKKYAPFPSMVLVFNEMEKNGLRYINRTEDKQSYYFDGEFK